MGKMMQEEHLELQLRKSTRGALLGCLVFALFVLFAALEEAKGRLADRGTQFSAAQCRAHLLYKQNYLLMMLLR